MHQRKSVMTIAGSDSSGGAGIQADLKTMCALGIYGTTAITALTAQNTLGVKDILTVSPAFLSAEIDAIMTDIPADAIKIGMVSDAALIEVIAKSISHYQIKNVVVDPVMVATSGARLLQKKAQSALCTSLLPLACLITPNVIEAEVLLNHSIASKSEMEKAALQLHAKYQTAVLIKGGHLNRADDCLCVDGEVIWIEGQYIQQSNTHGTGCTLSTAIACYLAYGEDLVSAIHQAKAYLTGALQSGLNMGKGSGPVDHLFGLSPSQHPIYFASKS